VADCKRSFQGSRSFQACLACQITVLLQDSCEICVFQRGKFEVFTSFSHHKLELAPTRRERGVPSCIWSEEYPWKPRMYDRKTVLKSWYTTQAFCNLIQTLRRKTTTVVDIHNREMDRDYFNLWEYLGHYVIYVLMFLYCCSVMFHSVSLMQQIAFETRKRPQVSLLSFLQINGTFFTLSFTFLIHILD